MIVVSILGQIKMSNQTERRVEDLLSRSKFNTNDSASTSNVSIRQSLPSTSSSVVQRATDIDKEKLSSQLRDLQNSRKVLSMTAPPPQPPHPHTHTP
jgi:ATP-dependent RNA helicase DHX36